VRKISDKNNRSGMVSLMGSLIVLFSCMLPVNEPLIDTPYIWIWGLYYWRSEYYIGTNTLFTQISMVLSIFILSCVIVIIITSNKLRKGGPFKTSGAILICLAVSIIVAVFFWAMIAHVMLKYLVEDKYTDDYGVEATVRYTIHFWAYNMPGFGLVGLIIGAIVILFGGIVAASNK
jgi:hypothetical protein